MNTSSPKPPMLCHFLMGIPASGKSTLADKIATLGTYKIVSTDSIRAQLYGDEAIQGDWQEIEAIAVKQIQEAINQHMPVIYDATNAKREWRMALLQKLPPHINWMGWYLQTPIGICQQWNKQRQRQVPDQVILTMADYLKNFPPVAAEGFVDIKCIQNPDRTREDISNIIRHIDRTVINRRNHTNNPSITFHSYSKLLDFDRLMHLISLLITYPGLGNLQHSNPSQLTDILGEVPPLENSLAEITAVMRKQKGAIYANPEAIAQDLQWLETNHIVSGDCLEFTPEYITEPLFLSTLEIPELTTHTYSDINPFRRLIIAIRLILHSPFLPKGESGHLEILAGHLAKAMNSGENYYNRLRKDIENVLKPYHILPPFSMRYGYFAGTGILSSEELIQLFRLLQAQSKTVDAPKAQSKTVDYPVTLTIYKKFQDRIGWSRLDESQKHPVRVIAHRSLIDPELFGESILINQIHKVETAIVEKQLLELKRRQGSASFQGDLQGYFKAWPLQIVFYNFAWYLAVEIHEGEKRRLLRFERLDRLLLGRDTYETRNDQTHSDAVNRMEKLLEASAGLFLGDNPTQQQKFFTNRSEIEVTVELWFTDEIFRFITEVTKRFPSNKIKMSSRGNTRETQSSARNIFSLDRTSDSSFPNRLQLTIPQWSLQDVDLWRWILGFAGGVKVVQPSSLQQLIYQKASAILAVYPSEPQK